MGCCGGVKVNEDLRTKDVEIEINDLNMDGQEGKPLTGPDEITLIYKTGEYKKGDKIKLFGEQFVINNKKICSIIHNKKQYDLIDYFELPEVNKEGTLEIKLKGIKFISNISGIFSYNYKLLSSPDISEWNTFNIQNMSQAFSGCANISGLKGISKWNTQNVTNMSEIFADCENCDSLPDISKWNTGNVTKMNKMFYNCTKLKSLPDISNWKTNNVTNMSYMFSECSSLSSMPDISKWNINNVINYENIFEKCSKLSILPNIFK
jgi:surface protein